MVKLSLLVYGENFTIELLMMKKGSFYTFEYCFRCKTVLTGWTPPGGGGGGRGGREGVVLLEIFYLGCAVRFT